MPKPSIEQSWRAVISGKRKDKTGAFLRGVFSAASKVFGLAVNVRFWLYKNGIIKRSWPGCLVISVGNITVGGTGKTPIVEIFARELTKGGRKVAIISRGYKARSPSWRKRRKNKKAFSTSKVVHDGSSLLLSARLSGDEPYMLAKNLGNVVVITDPDRVRGSRFAINNFGVDTILLDDGMQHIKIRRQIEVVLIDATCPFGYEHLFPRGLLREPIKSLKRASHIFITKSKNIDIQPIVERIRQYNTDAEIISCHYEPVELVNFHTDEHIPISDVRDMNIFVMTGIAQPDGFVKLLKDIGGNVQRVYTYPDHHKFTHAEIEHVYKRAKNWNADGILVTQKDAVRFSKRAGASIRPCPVYYLKVAIKISSGEEDFTDCITRICYP